MALRRADASTLRLAAAALVVFTAALGVRLLGVADAPMMLDEYYTILAARSYAAEGVPRIGGGEYWRAPAFTALVAASLTHFGDTLAAARLPSVLASAIGVALAFVWLLRAAGPGAAWLLALMLGLSAAAIEVAQFSRFYALHSLLFLGCALAVYALVFEAPGAASSAPRRRSLVPAFVAAACAAGAWQLQPTTAIGLVALAITAGLVLASRTEVRAFLRTRAGAFALVGAALGLAVLAILVLSSGWAQQQVAAYRWAAAWAEDNRDNALFYVHVFARELPLLLYTFPLAFVFALARAPRPAFFSIGVCAAALALHSFAGMKAIRYVDYLWPLLLAPFAIAGAALLDAAARSATAIVRRVSSPTAAAPRVAAFARVAAALTLGAAVAVALAGNPDFRKFRSLPADVAAGFGVGPAAQALRARKQGERAMVQAIDALARSGGVLVTSNDLLALWHLGRFDLVLRAGRLKEIVPRREFGRDPRTGAVVISQPASLELVMRCRPAGTVVVWPGDWRRSVRVPAAVADLIEARMQEIALPGDQGARAFRWSGTARPDAACSVLDGEARGVHARRRPAE